MRIFILLYTFFLSINILSADSSIKIIPPQSKYDSSHDYFYGLLQLILSETEEEYGYKRISFSNKMEQGRAFIALKNKAGIDIHWAGTSLKREEEFRTVKIPLVKGLLGYRFFVINKDNKNKFDNIKTLDDLKKLTACQGAHWPDTDILENAGLKVLRNVNYELMFLQVEKGRCDYFPRGIHEIVLEVEARKDKYPNLMMYQDLIVYYPFPMYFFVAKDNETLASRIEEGLVSIIENGKFDTYIKSHLVTRHLFPINDWINTKAFKIDNPFLNIEKKYFNEKFWIFFE